jgi:hypothetical protein
LLFLEDKIIMFFVYLNPISVRKIQQFIVIVTKKKEASEIKNVQLQFAEFFFSELELKMIYPKKMNYHQ